MLTPTTLAASFFTWNILYSATKALLSKVLDTDFARRHIPETKARKLLKEQAPAYIISTIHALFVTYRGLNHLVTLFRAPIAMKLHNPNLAPRELDSPYIPSPHERRFIAEIHGVTQTNLVLAGYLLCDLYHIVKNFPSLGSYDTILHHVAFFYCALIAGHFQLFPFMFGWLIVGEASTPLLNLRWFLIKSGYGHTSFLKLVQLLFAAVFFVTRFAIYSAGLFYQLEMVPRVPPYIPTWAVYSALTFVVIGFFLNIVWLYKIALIAFGASSRSTQRSRQQTSSEHSEPSEASTQPIKQD